MLTVINMNTKTKALIYSLMLSIILMIFPVATGIVILTCSLIPVMIWHSLYNFINWLSSAMGTIEILLILVQSVVMIGYGLYLWTKLPIDKAPRRTKPWVIQ